MKIVFFIQNFSRGAGSERATALVANQLASRGHDVVILSICSNNRSFFEIDDRVVLRTLLTEEEVDNRKRFFEVFSLLNQCFREENCEICIDVFASLSIFRHLDSVFKVG